MPPGRFQDRGATRGADDPCLRSGGDREKGVGGRAHRDNAACIAFANSTAPLEKTKHITNRDRFVRKAVNTKQVKTMKIHTKKQPVDGLTKAIGGDEFKRMRLFLQRGREV